MIISPLRRSLLTLAATLFGCGTLAAQESNHAELNRQGLEFLNTHCRKCHHDDSAYPGLDILDRNSLLVPVIATEKPFLVAGNAELSRIWKQVEAGEMPPAEEPQPSAAERETFKRWIESGAEFPPAQRTERPFLGENSLLELIQKDLLQLTPAVKAETRYFSLAHLWNDNVGTSDEQLRIVRAGLSKLLNSLSTNPQIIIPRTIDPDYQTIFAIRLSDYGWTPSTWQAILRRYPYAIQLPGRAAANVYEQLGTNIPTLRADWFLNTAARPPLYHEILDLPNNAQALEKSLGVDVQQNFLDGKIARAAFQKSGVSQQNRMVERHAGSSGSSVRYYWKSYDMKPNKGEVGIFTLRPLEPKPSFDTRKLQLLAPFEHDGGEIIWSLPNGLQGYMLVTATDDRIDEGPPDIVFDREYQSGSSLIVNGISCMGCHKQGMILFEKDEIRPLFENTSGKLASKVLQIYPPNSEMQTLMQRDREDFMRANRAAVAPFFKELLNSRESTDPLDKPLDTLLDNLLDNLPDPITRGAQPYRLTISIETAERELGLPSGKLDALRQLPELSTLGLGNLRNAGGVVSRSDWERSYRALARFLGIGTPIVVP